MPRRGGQGGARRSKHGKGLPVLPVRDAVHFPEHVNTLLVGREVSLRALHRALEESRNVLVLTQTDVGVEDPTPDDLHRFGTVSEVIQVLPMPDGTMRVALKGLHRFSAERVRFEAGYIRATGSEIPEKRAGGADIDASMREAVRLFEAVMQLGKQIPFEAMQAATHEERAGALADLIAHHLPIRPAQKQAILEITDPRQRLETTLQLLNREKDVLELQQDIRTRVEEELGATQREYYLREQLKIIQQELNERDERGGEVSEYLSRIEQSGMPIEVRERAESELRRLERSPSASPEAMVIRTYLDWLTSLPWQHASEDRLDVRSGKEILDRDHFGLEKVKDRVLDFLAVRQISRSLRGPILCFVGPPGVGKTSIGRSIAEAMGRKFVRMSLGGIRDEAEIRGHRRTYIGSMPGRIIANIKQCGTRNPVFMLDEVDKLGMDYRGDPTSALLEALDPEQNDRFTDHYIEAHFDLSAVMFICTANLLENIPWPLRDRMETIHFPSYTEDEKVRIAVDFLLPKRILEHGLKEKDLKISSDTIRHIVRNYTREAGVRNLEREIATICRKTARLHAEGSKKKLAVTAALAEGFLGPPRYPFGTKSENDEIGVATGAVYTEFGGDIVSIEVALTPALGPEPKVILTGQLGDVMKESAQTALTCVRTELSHADVQPKVSHDVHVHVPAGAVPKDGPSAGITIATAYASHILGKPVRADVAMTGEITLRGKVLPVGGLREKILAAHRAGIRRMIIPRENLKDLSEVPKNALDQIEVLPVRTLGEVLQVALDGSRKARNSRR